MCLLIIGTGRLTIQALAPWPSTEALTRILYGLGLGIPCVVGVGLGIWAAIEVSLGMIIACALTLVVGAGFLAADHQRPRRERYRWGRMVSWLDPQPLYSFGLRIGRGLTAIAREVALMLDGEAALLWMLVILILLYIGYRGAA
jgi:hypothetical protein